MEQLNLFTFTPGQDLIVDVSVVSPFTNTHHAEAAVGHAANLREKNKRSTYAQELEGIHCALFTPFVMESLGGRGPITDRLMRQLASAQACLNGQTVSECQRFLSNFKQRAIRSLLARNDIYLATTELCRGCCLIVSPCHFVHNLVLLIFEFF